MCFCVLRSRLFPTRASLAGIFERLNYTRGVELGVQHGNFAVHNLKNWPSCKEYLLVDLWRQQRNYKDFANVGDKQQRQIMETALQNVRPYREKTRVCRDYTTQCAKHEPDAHFDVVYVDARHNYDGAMDDMVTWWPKVKRGGVLAGHDYMTADEVKRATPTQDWSLNEDNTRNDGAVKGAVDDFSEAASDRGLQGEPLELVGHSQVIY